jgi:hypothetical protein
MAAIGIALFVLICRLFPVVVVEERPHPRDATGPIEAAAGR